MHTGNVGQDPAHSGPAHLRGHPRKQLHPAAAQRVAVARAGRAPAVPPVPCVTRKDLHIPRGCRLR